MNYNSGLADLYRQHLRNRTTPPLWLRKVMEPMGDRVICRDYRGGNRVVDRRIWAKLDDRARGQFIERIRAEQRA